MELVGVIGIGLLGSVSLVGSLILSSVIINPSIRLQLTPNRTAASWQPVFPLSSSPPACTLDNMVHADATKAPAQSSTNDDDAATAPAVCRPEHAFHAFDSLYCALTRAQPIKPVFVDDKLCGAPSTLPSKFHH